MQFLLLPMLLNICCGLSYTSQSILIGYSLLFSHWKALVKGLPARQIRGMTMEESEEFVQNQLRTYIDIMSRHANDSFNNGLSYSIEEVDLFYSEFSRVLVDIIIEIVPHSRPEVLVQALRADMEKRLVIDNSCNYFLKRDLIESTNACAPKDFSRFLKCSFCHDNYIITCSDTESPYCTSRWV